jgi:GNAT superfamily N-acetyltransferase
VTSFVTEPLSREHARTAFHCDVEPLDRYLKQFALQDMQRRIAGCFVALDDARKIVGFYTLAATSVALDVLPTELTKRLPRYQAVPAVLIGRLAVDAKCHGKGLGRFLIGDAIMRTDALGIGAFALVVDAKDEAAQAFYETVGFIRITGDNRRLFLPMATAMAALK